MLVPVEITSASRRKSRDHHRTKDLRCETLPYFFSSLSSYQSGYLLYALLYMRVGLDMKNPTRDEHVHKNDMAKFLEDTNQGTLAQGDSCAFPFFGNIGAPLMTTLNISGFNVGLLVWFWTTPNVLNSLDASQINTLC
jgi:hypothetical protein